MAALAADVGGTKTLLALSIEGKVVKKEKVSNAGSASFSQVLAPFLEGFGVHVKSACLGVAGPVFDNVCRATNLPWVLDGAQIAQEFAIDSVRLLNDMEASGYGLSCLDRKELFVLSDGSAVKRGNAALVSAGTGLGEAGLYWDGRRHHPFATEGAHADFAPRNAQEIELLTFLQREYGHVSYERVVSGMGIENLYRFLVQTGKEKGSKRVEEGMKDGEEAPKLISEQALKGKDAACVRTLEWFISLYAAEAGNVALKFLCTGGVYLGGGIAPKLLPLFSKERFIQSFADKGRFQEVLKTFPLFIVLNEETALIGALKCAQDATCGL